MTLIKLIRGFVFQYYLQVLPYSVQINVSRAKLLFFPAPHSLKQITLFFSALRSTILPLTQGRNFRHP